MIWKFSMPATISILHLEDSLLDAEFVRDRLARAGLETQIDHVVEQKTFVDRLKSRSYDIILSDYRVPTFEGLEALDFARELQPRTPFIFISGTMGEELAVETLRRGATDYVLKERLVRLPSAVERALNESKKRSELREAESALAESEGRFRQLANTIPNLAWMAKPDGSLFWYNDRWYEYTGTTFEEMQGWGWQRLHDPEMLPQVMERWKQSLATGEPFEMVFPLRGADGQFRPFLTLVSPHRGESGEILYWFGTNTDISTQKRAEEQLLRLARHEAQRAEVLSQLAIAAQTINSVLSVDGILDAVAREARRILRVQTAVATVAETDRESETVKVSANPAMNDASLPDADSTRSIEAPLLGHGGREIGCLRVSGKEDGAFTDEDQAVLVQLSAIAAVSIENARLYESLRVQDRQKDEFLATLAHELRNPLAPIRNSLHILRLAANRDLSTEHVCDMMDRQVNHMVRLVDDLLEISRITKNRIELKLENVEVAGVIRSAVETSRPLIDAAGHKLEIDVPAAPLFVRGDVVRLSQVLANLLNNAAKYTPDGGRIFVTAQREGDHAILTVRDTGVGIANEMLSRVFDMFTQVNRSGTRAQGGLGIGLYLVRNLVHMHDGTVEAKSGGLGQGSEFIIRLPLAQQPSLPSANPPEKLPLQIPSKRVLVVDDNQDAANSLAMLLRFLGADVKVVYDGRSALKAVDEYSPAVILLDLGMPEMDGYEVANELHQRPNFGQTKLIALTGWGQEEHRRRVFSAGFDHHLVKPAEISDLKALLASLPSESAS
ncbi:MAG TPA: response regulator [Planctomycetaceae bacterium]|nr:response regulator [Planctomycetaceae bacterium]